MCENHSYEGPASHQFRDFQHIVVPLLPLRVHEVGPFSISRTRLTLSRLYIVAQIHLPHLRAIGDLALWTNYENSLVGCIVS